MAEQTIEATPTRLGLGERLRLLSRARLDLLCRVRQVKGQDTCCAAHCLAFLYAMIDSADADGCTRLSIAEISERCRCSRRTAVKTSRLLQDEGVIAVERRSHKPGVPKADSANAYAVVWSKLDALGELTVDASMAAAVAAMNDEEPADEGNETEAAGEIPSDPPSKKGPAANPRPRSTSAWGDAMARLRGIGSSRRGSAEKQLLAGMVEASEALQAMGCVPPTSVEDAWPGAILRFLVPGWQLMLEPDAEGALVLTPFRDDGEARRG